MQLSLSEIVVCWYQNVLDLGVQSKVIPVIWSCVVGKIELTKHTKLDTSQQQKCVSEVPLL